jgi:hypothetical protein
MSRQPLFSEILEAKLENQGDLKQFNHCSSRDFDTDPAHLAYLMSQVQRLKTPLKAANKAYPHFPSRPITPYNLTELEAKAQAFFQNWSETLSPRFSRAELRSAFRRLAKKLHPDLSPSSAQEFMELKKSYEILKLIPKR